MATTLYLRNTKSSGVGIYRDMLIAAGAAANTGVVNTAASGTSIQWTKTAGGELMTFITGRSPSAGWTLAGLVSFSLWAEESQSKANCGIMAHLLKRTAAGVETEIDTGWAYGAPDEITAVSAAEYLWTATPTSTNFAADDRLMLAVYIINVGTMATGYTCTLTYAAAPAATGDSFLQLTENVTFKNPTVLEMGQRPQDALLRM